MGWAGGAAVSLGELSVGVHWPNKAHTNRGGIEWGEGWQQASGQWFSGNRLDVKVPIVG